MKTKIIALSGVLFLLLALVFPVAALANGTEIRSVHVTADLQPDGSAHITEVWDITAVSGGEWFIPIKSLDNQVVSELTVTDENGLTFEPVEHWDSSLSREQRAYKSGILDTGDGYELCWGFGEYGPHTYTVQYKITNLVKGYNEADGLTHVFVGDNAAATIGDIRITLRKPGTAFTHDDTGMWVFGFSANYSLEDGEVVVQSDQPMPNSQSAMVMLQFGKGMFEPADVRARDFEDVKQAELEGSDYTPDEEDQSAAEGGGYYNGGGYTPNYGFSAGNLFGGFFRFFGVLIPIAAVAGIFIAIGRAATKGGGGGAHMKPEYKNTGYSRALPWGGSLPATYARLDELRQLDSEAGVIGAYMLRWIRSRQVELVKEQAGVFKNKEEDAIKLYAARPGMEPVERELYDMLLQAAGGDYVLQSKEFEKWSRKKYEQVQGWLERYKNQGKNTMRQLGALTEVDTKVFFGLVNSRKTVYTPAGEKLTQEMFGFKKYLEDFTIINEREAREVQLWDDYLVFAQVFGIADKVADQFKQLYPDYFVKMAQDLGYTRLDMFDIYMITRMANAYGRAMANGYKAGYNAAHSTRYTGGGGHSSFGGGGGGSFSGGSGGGAGAGSR